MSEHQEYAVRIKFADGQQSEPKGVTDDVSLARKSLDEIRYDNDYRVEHEKHYTPCKAVLVSRTVTDWCEVHEQEKENNDHEEIHEAPVRHA